MDIKHALGKAIAHHRKLAGVPQKDITDQPGLSRIENGKQSPSIERLESLAEQIGVRTSDIWATAESYLTAKPKGKAIARTIKGITLLGARTEWRTSLSSLVEEVIATTPSALPGLRSFLRQYSAKLADAGDREMVARLINRVDTALARKLAKVSASRVHAGGG